MVLKAKYTGDALMATRTIPNYKMLLGWFWKRWRDANFFWKKVGHAATMQAHVRPCECCKYHAGYEKKAPLLTNVHCSSCVINLILNTSSSVSQIRNIFSIIVEAAKNYINDSAKCHHIFQDALDEEEGRTLVNICEMQFF
jgi:hypothetical protein